MTITEKVQLAIDYGILEYEYTKTVNQIKNLINEYNMNYDDWDYIRTEQWAKEINNKQAYKHALGEAIEKGKKQ